MGVRVTPGVDSLNSIEIHPRPGKQINPAVTFDGTNYFVVWGDKTIDTMIYYIAASRISTGGAILDTTVIISGAAGSSDAVYIDCESDGNRCLAIWRQSSSICGRFLNHGGQPEGNIFTIASGSVSGPALAFDGANYLAIWFSGAYPNLDMRGQLVSPQGVLIGSVISVSLTVGCHRWPKVIFDGANYLAVWMTGANSPDPQYINGQFISPSGALVGGNFAISSSTANQRWYPAAAPSDSNVLVAWVQASTDIYGNVDTGPAMVSEAPAHAARPSLRSPTILSGPDLPFDLRSAVIRDVAGRRVGTVALKPGIYFVEVEGSVRYKVIKLR